MAGIRMIERDGTTVLHPTVWVDPEEVPILFLVVKDGATALAHPDYVGETLYSVGQGDLDLQDAWDYLLIKTRAMNYPQPCEVVSSTVDNDTPVHFKVNGQVVHRMAH